MPVSQSAGSEPAAGRRGRVGPFVTLVEYERPDGHLARWESRRHRKHLARRPVGSTWWAPGARGWWIGVLFAVGSVLFALGAVPAYAVAAGNIWDEVTFFAGSLFFTSAAFLTYREAVDAVAVPQQGAHRAFFVFQPARIDWWATVVQLVGTLFFNISCGFALATGLSAPAAHRHVWRPDALGSICFLLASALAWFEACHGWFAWAPRTWSWWITAVNLVGSLAFGLAAIDGYINPQTGQLTNAERSGTATFVGALCFFVGAVLLLPERTEPDSEEPGAHSRERPETSAG
jgi:hypothetical protein